MKTQPKHISEILPKAIEELLKGVEKPKADKKKN